MRERTYFVYILASDSGILYTGVTNDLLRRMYQHRNEMGSGFVNRYRVHKLVWWEQAWSPLAAITREKQLKSWRRSKRVALIDESNPQWLDLACDWFR